MITLKANLGIINMDTKTPFRKKLKSKDIDGYEAETESPKELVKYSFHKISYCKVVVTSICTKVHNYVPEYVTGYCLK